MIPAATAYVALTFVAGFVVGMVREFIVRPMTGETAALLIEAPVMLVITFMAARWALTKMMPDADVNGRLKMGLIAFAWLMLLEIGGNYVLRGQTPGQWITHLQTLPGMISLLLFATFPLMPVFAGHKSASHRSAA